MIWKMSKWPYLKTDKKHTMAMRHKFGTLHQRVYNLSEFYTKKWIFNNWHFDIFKFCLFCVSRVKWCISRSCAFMYVLISFDDSTIVIYVTSILSNNYDWVKFPSWKILCLDKSKIIRLFHIKFCDKQNRQMIWQHFKVSKYVTGHW